MKNEKKSDDLYQKIIEQYEAIGSIKQVADMLGTNEIKVRRVLITEGMWESKSSKDVGALFAQGFTSKEIAEQLCMSEKNVQSYLPYTKGSYGGEKSHMALRSEKYRVRQKEAEKKQTSLKNINKNNKDLELKEAETSSEITEFSLNLSKDERDAIERLPSVLRLRFELVAQAFMGGQEIQLKDDDRKVFLKNAKAKEGIIREVLVHGEMNLHSMHYMIQQIFGWQNSHLHNYELSEEDFNRITKEQDLREYLSFVGSIFKYPMEDLKDRFWDDDYSVGRSFKSWLRSKYQLRFEDNAVEDTFVRNRERVAELERKYKKQLGLHPHISIRDFQEIIHNMEKTNAVLEGIPVRNVFKKGQPTHRNMSGNDWRRYQHSLVEGLEVSWDKAKQHDRKSCMKIIDMMDDICMLRGNIQNIEQALSYGQASDVQEFYNMDPTQVIIEQKGMIEELLAVLRPCMADMNPITLPFTDTLYYVYDFGDGWTVKITCEEVYYANDNYDIHYLDDYIDNQGIIHMPERVPAQNLQYTDGNGNPVDEIFREKLQTAYIECKPVCVYVDGLNVMDDVGGIYGYMEFLESLQSEDIKEREESKMWGRYMGWTGRKKKPESVL